MTRLGKELWMNKGSTHPRGFTIIELLVVISILGILMGMLMPALGAARDRVHKTRELNDIRQLGLAWTMYANNHADSVLPGYLETGAQERWRVRYTYPTHDFIPPAPNFQGNDLNIAGPWTWRLLPYLDWNHDIVHGYKREAEQDIFAMINEAEEVAETPAFGYNAYYIGGWMDLSEYGQHGMDQTRVLPRFAFSHANGKLLSLVVNSIAQARKPSELVTFCSSASRFSREFRKVPDNIDGSHYVVPPILADMDMWRLPTNIASETASLIESIGEINGQSAPVPIGRYTGAAAILRIDGSVANQTPSGLLDQRLWINIANEKYYSHEDWKHQN
jgi:prepilin-type N-terminal cleavage/methylation domain-containing protein